MTDPMSIAIVFVTAIETQTSNLNDQDYIETLEEICSALKASVCAKLEEMGEYDD